MYGKSRPLCTTGLSIPLLTPLELRKVQLGRGGITLFHLGSVHHPHGGPIRPDAQWVGVSGSAERVEFLEANVVLCELGLFRAVAAL